jgi:hypothetical protein
MVSLNRVVNALSLLAVAAGAASLESPTSPSTTRPSSLVATRRQYLPAGHAEYEFGPRQEKLFNTTMVAIQGVSRAWRRPQSSHPRSNYRQVPDRPSVSRTLSDLWERRGGCWRGG